MKYDIKILNIMAGCGLLSKKLKSHDIGEILLFSILVLLLKSLLVMVAYNHIVPKLLKNISQEYNLELFRPITVVEGLWIVLLFTNLVNYW